MVYFYKRLIHFQFARVHLPLSDGMAEYLDSYIPITFTNVVVELNLRYDFEGKL